MMKTMMKMMAVMMVVMEGAAAQQRGEAGPSVGTSQFVFKPSSAVVVLIDQNSVGSCDQLI